MEELVTKDSTQSSAGWQAMEEMARRHIQQWLQGLLEDEVTQFLGRARYHRRDEGERGYRNGYGKPRWLTTRAGTVTVRRPAGSEGWSNASRARCCRCSRCARRRSTTCCRSFTCTGWRWATRAGAAPAVGDGAPLLLLPTARSGSSNTGQRETALQALGG